MVSASSGNMMAMAMATGGHKCGSLNARRATSAMLNFACLSWKNNDTPAFFMRISANRPTTPYQIMWLCDTTATTAAVATGSYAGKNHIVPSWGRRDSNILSCLYIYIQFHTSTYSYCQPEWSPNGSIIFLIYILKNIEQSCQFLHPASFDSKRFMYVHTSISLAT